MKGKKIIAFMITIILSLAVLAGCSGEATETTTTTPPVLTTTTTPIITATTTPAATATTTPAVTTATTTPAMTATTTPAVTTATTAPPISAGDIVDIAMADGRFTTLVNALIAADLVDTLKGPGPFTVFAPTDDAFAKLPEGTLEGLLEDIPALTDILLYHVVSGKVMAEDVLTLDSADTLADKSVTITILGDTVMINDAEVIITDIEASNGVIHVIDTVLIPE